MARAEIDVSKNWLLPIEGVMHSDVMTRRLGKVLGMRESAGVPGYMVRALKEQGVHYLLQLLAVDRRDFIEKSPKANMEEILDCAEIAVLRLLKDGGAPESVWIGKYKNAAGEGIPMEKTPEAYRLMAEYITGHIYQNLAVVTTSDMLVAEEETKAEPEQTHAERMEELRKRYKGPQVPKRSLKKEDTKAKADYGASRRGMTRTNAQRRAANQNVKKSSAPQSSNGSVDLAAQALKAKFESGVSIEKFIEQNFSAAQEKEIVSDFCDARNINVVEQAYAIDQDVFRAKLPMKIRKVFASALRSYGKRYKGISVGDLASNENREALRMTFSEALGEHIFSGNKKQDIDLVSALIVKKAMERQQQQKSGLGL